jgi:hypothetical protein
MLKLRESKTGAIRDNFKMIIIEGVDDNDS